MVRILNKLEQPLPINLKHGNSVHLMAREEKEIELEDLDSAEIKHQIEVGNVIVLRMD